MNEALFYGPGDSFGWFLNGCIVGFIIFCVICCLIGADNEDNKKKTKTKRTRTRKKPEEVVDAHFVEVRPKALPQPSQALVRRSTSLSTNRNSRLIRR